MVNKRTPQQLIWATVFMTALATLPELVLAAPPALSVSGSTIKAGNSVAQLSGMSLFWSNSGWGGEKYYTAGSVGGVKKFFGGNLVRAAMGVEDSGGYLSDREGNLRRAEAIVDAAIANDMYVIIDWHSHYAHEHQAEAIEFFQHMARKYGKNSNVIYEIFNEPKNDVTWAQHVKPYAEQVVKAIRAIDPDNLIIVGTTTWSQDVDQAADNPIRGYANIAYTLHFYAGTHGQGLRDKAAYAMSKGAALFVTEWGSVNADGNGGVNQTETDRWAAFMKKHSLGNANWALNDKSEGASAFRPGTPTNGQWSDGMLTDSGRYVKNLIQTWPNKTGSGSGGSDGGSDGGTSGGYKGVVNLPGRIEAEHYTTASDRSAGNASASSSNCTYYGLNVDVQNASEGTCNVGWTESGETLTYKVGAAGGNFDITARLASVNNGQRVRIDVNGQLAGIVSTDGAGWQAWASETISNVNIPANATVKVTFLDGMTNLNYLDIKRASTSGGGNGGGTDTGGGSGGEPTNGAVSCNIGQKDAWGNVFVLNGVEVKNTGSRTLSNWKVAIDFEQPVQVSENWSAKVLSVSGKRVVFEGVSYNSRLNPNQATTFGFKGSQSGNISKATCSAL
ncbi:cellulase family glycosylhydrolase [Allohahella marinimesophila]|uniref:Endoglucanase n=1 Tax=Allohahella marinimesophila TaxID=1054972 RepID=A0ABP7Q2D3_9GAMM